ncbi:MAG: hypothetical protein R2854_25490 [Caldilineaceae bacterium]
MTPPPAIERHSAIFDVFLDMLLKVTKRTVTAPPNGASWSTAASVRGRRGSIPTAASWCTKMIGGVATDLAMADEGTVVEAP